MNKIRLLPLLAFVFAMGLVNQGLASVSSKNDGASVALTVTVPTDLPLKSIVNGGVDITPGSIHQGMDNIFNVIMQCSGNDFTLTITAAESPVNPGAFTADQAKITCPTNSSNLASVFAYWGSDGATTCSSHVSEGKACIASEGRDFYYYTTS